MRFSEFDKNDRMNMVEYIVTKRQKNFEYIRQLHEGDFFWLNSVRLTQQDITEFYGCTRQKRTEQFFILGVSIAPLLHFANGSEYVRALAQLMEEYEYHFASSTVQSVMRIKSRQENSEGDEILIKPSIVKRDKIVVYEYLQTPNIPCDLDYVEVIFTLCELLIHVYRKFVDPSSASATVHEAIVKIDDRMKHHIITAVSMDLNRIANNVAQAEAHKFDPVFGDFLSSATPGVGVKDMLSMLTGGMP